MSTGLKTLGLAVLTGCILQPLSQERGGPLVRRLGSAAFRQGWQVTALAYSVDGTILLAGDTEGNVRTWRAATGEPVRRYEGQRGFVRALAFVDGGKAVASIAASRTLCIWNVTSGERLASVRVEGEGELHAAAIDGGRDTAVIGLGNAVELWSISQRRVLKRMGGAHRLGVSAVACWQDAAVSAGMEGDVAGWTSAGDEAWRIHTSTSIRTLALTTDATCVAGVGMGASPKLWRMKDAKELACQFSASKLATSFAWFPDGKSFVLGEAEGRVSTCRPEAAEASQSDTRHPTAVLAVAVSPDGKHYAAAEGRWGAINVRSTADGKCTNSGDGHGSRLTSVAMTPSNDHVITSAQDGSIRSWESGTGKCIAIWNGPKGLLSFALGEGMLAALAGTDITLLTSPKLEELASINLETVRPISVGLAGGAIIVLGQDGGVWRVDSKERKAVLLVDSKLPGCRTMAVGTRMVAVASRKAAEVRRLDDGVVVWKVTEPDGGLECIALSADGGTMVTGHSDGRIRIWTSASDAPARVIAGDAWIRMLALSSDGRMCASATLNGTVNLFAVESGAPLGSLAGHQGGVWCVAFGSKKRLVSGGSDCTAIIWQYE